MSSWLEASQAGGRGFDGHLAKHFTLRFGKCWRLRPNPARCFGAQPCGFTSISKPEVVDASRCRGEAQSCPLAATQPTQRAFRSTRLTDEGASKRRSQRCDLICRCDPPPVGVGRRRSADGTQDRPVRTPIRVCEHGQPMVGRRRMSLTAAHNNGCLLCAAIVRCCPARNP